MDNEETVGDRLLRAFKEIDGTEDKEIIAEILGYESKGAIYKIVAGKMELKFSALIRFRDYTKRSIDWLLTGEKEQREDTPQSFENLIRLMIRTEVGEALSSQNGNNNPPEFSDEAPTKRSSIRSQLPATSNRELPENVGVMFKDWDKLSEEEQAAAIEEIRKIVEVNKPSRARKKRR